MTINSYQFLPELLPEEFEALKSSIAERGVDVPIIVDQDGNIIEGFHRQRACDELRIFCPREVRHFETDAERFELALRLNCRRRQLNRQQKRELIAVYLLRDPQIADNFLSEIIGGLSKNTVAEVRHELEATCQIDKFETLRGKDQKERPRKYKKIIANTPKEAEKAIEVISELPENCKGKLIDVTTAKRRAARSRNAAERNEQRKLATPLAEDAIQLHHCPFQNLESVAGIDPESTQLICTDIPYDQSFVPQVAELGEFARRVLVDGGLFVTYCGQYWMHKVLELLGRSLTYRWTNASVWEGDATPVHIGGWKEPHARVVSKWKPILIFSKGGFPRKGQWHDVSYVRTKEKNWHPWQQPLPEVEKLVRDFSKPGDLVIDPCGGGFTTAEACLRLSRRCISCDVDQNCVIDGQERLSQAKAILQSELRVVVEDAEELEPAVCKQHVRDFWTYLTECEESAIHQFMNGLPDSLKAVYERLPEAVA
jgi:site-specific DNA-methyltransferase (adenine-specific)